MFEQQPDNPAACGVSTPQKERKDNNMSPPELCFRLKAVSRLFEGRERTLRQQALAKLLQASLKQLYGVIGGAVAFDILSYDEMSASARIQVNSR